MDKLRSKATRAFLWDLFGSYGAQIVSFVITIFLARLLTPEDFGLVGMSLVFISMLQIFRDFGFASALIQNENNTSLTYSSVFYLNVVAGLIITAFIYIVAPLIGEFYNNQLISKLVRLLSITFFLGSLNVVQSTILRRDLNFKVLTLRNLISQLISGIIAVILSFMGYGVYALIAQQIIAAIVSTILLWKVTHWYPRLEFSWNEVRKLSGFSLYVFASSSIDKFFQQLDTLVIGKLFSPATLGYFSRAKSLNNLIARNSSSSITKVFFPALSQIKSDEERFERIYLRVIHIVSTVAVLLTAVCYLVGEELIIGLFGSKWRLSIPIFQILIIKGFTFPVSGMIVNAFMAKGKSKENFYFGNIRKALQLVPFIFAYFNGFYAFLYANLAVAIIGWGLNNLFAYLSLKISFKKQIMSVAPQVAIAAILIFIIAKLIPDDFSYSMALLKAGLFGIMYTIYLKLVNSPVITEGVTLISKLKNRSNHVE